MSEFVTVIGGVNLDIAANMTSPFVEADSIPGHVSMSCGGVARNIAHNLLLMDNHVKFISVFGGDIFGEMCHRECETIGLDLSLTERLEGERNGLYLCVNDMFGEMRAAVADNDIISHLTPAFLEKRLTTINQSAAIVADTNISTETLQYLIDHSTAPLCIDTVSTTKAPRVVTALQQSAIHRLHCLKLNLMEALTVTNCDTAQEAAAQLIAMGVEQVFITLGADGVYCCNGIIHEHIAAIPTHVINTTGAGDAFMAGVVHGHLQHAPFPESAKIGLRAARATLLSQQTVNPNVKQYI